MKKSEFLTSVAQEIEGIKNTQTTGFDNFTSFLDKLTTLMRPMWVLLSLL